MRWLLVAFGICCIEIAAAQSKAKQLVFAVNINQNPVELGSKYYLESIGDSVEFETIKFYISNIEFLQNGKVVEQLPQKHFLIDLEKPNSLRIQLSAVHIEYNQLRFQLGVDSITNHSGAMGGDLDPTNGMYWTWQSGYINLKIEGKSPVCLTRKNAFQLHIGGFQSPFNTLQTVVLDCNQKQSELVVQLSLNELIKSINITQNYQVMSPNNEAMRIAKLMANQFKAMP